MRKRIALLGCLLIAVGESIAAAKRKENQLRALEGRNKEALQEIERQ